MTRWCGRCSISVPSLPPRCTTWSIVWGSTFVETARLRAVKDQAWERVWLKDWKPMRFGRRLWVCPSVADAPADPDAVVVRLDPGLAFGTGSHPTTALCLQVLESLPLANQTVIDYGCGSGILGIARSNWVQRMCCIGY